MEAVMMRSLGIALCAMLLGFQIGPAMGQSGTDPATQFTGFLCEINLGENGLNTSQYVSPLVKDGIIFTFNSSKLCTGSAPGENIKIDCTGRIPGWKGANINLQDVPCTVGGAACGTPGILTATNNRLSVDASGNATLTCQYKE
jgi:hypothetical protein